MENQLPSSPIDAYIAKAPPAVQMVLEEIRDVIRRAAPGATERISYGIPTFDLNGKHLVHFAAFKNHVGLYPGPSGIEAFREELSPYKSAKGSVQLPYGQPLPVELVRRIVQFRVQESTGGVSKSGQRTGVHLTSLVAWALTAALLGPAGLGAQDSESVRITRRVMDAVSGAPVERARVGPTGTDLFYATGEDGAYVLEPVLPGS